jgi:hypothetical protein
MSILRHVMTSILKRDGPWGHLVLPVRSPFVSAVRIVGLETFRPVFARLLGLVKYAGWPRFGTHGSGKLCRSGLRRHGADALNAGNLVHRFRALSVTIG